MAKTNHAVAIALAAMFVDTIGFGITMPVMPALITQLGHVDMVQATRISGYMLMLFAVAQFFAGPVVGNLSDHFGRRPVLIAAMLAFGIDYALMAGAPTLGWLFLGRAVAGITGAVYAPVGSVIADALPPEKRAGAFGYMGAAFGLGFIVGPALGGLLATFGPRAPFIAAAALAILNALAMMILLPETLARENRRPFDWKSANVVSAFAPLMRIGGAAPMIVAWFCWQLAHNVYPATWGFWGAIRFGWDAKAIGWSLAYVGIVMALVQGLLVGRAIARIGQRNALIIGLVSGGIAFAVYAFVTREWMAYAIFVIGALQGFVHPAMSGTLSAMVDAKHQGALQGGLASMGSLSSIVGPLVLTQALATGAQHGFPGGAFLLAALLALVSLAIVLIYVRSPDASEAAQS